MANITLLHEVLDKIKANPEGWFQGYWAQKRFDEEGEFCGTAYCFAGWTCVMSGYEILFSEMYSYANMVNGAADGGSQSIASAAMHLLDIDERTADELFEGCNNLEMLEAYVEDIEQNGHITRARLDLF